MKKHPRSGKVSGKRTVPSWDVRTAPLERVIEKYADKPKPKAVTQ